MQLRNHDVMPHGRTATRAVGSPLGIPTLGIPSSWLGFVPGYSLRGTIYRNSYSCTGSRVLYPYSYGTRVPAGYPGTSISRRTVRTIDAMIDIYSTITQVLG